MKLISKAVVLAAGLSLLSVATADITVTNFARDDSGKLQKTSETTYASTVKAPKLPQHGGQYGITTKVASSGSAKTNPAPKDQAKSTGLQNMGGWGVTITPEEVKAESTPQPTTYRQSFKEMNPHATPSEVNKAVAAHNQTMSADDAPISPAIGTVSSSKSTATADEHGLSNCKHNGLMC